MGRCWEDDDDPARGVTGDAMTEAAAAIAIGSATASSSSLPSSLKLGMRRCSACFVVIVKSSPTPCSSIGAGDAMTEAAAAIATGSAKVSSSSPISSLKLGMRRRSACFVVIVKSSPTPCSSIGAGLRDASASCRASASSRA